MKLYFGKGKIAVTVVASKGKGHLSDALVLEDGLGTGVINEIVESRKKDTELDLDEINKKEDAAILYFSNPESVRVVIEALKEIEEQLKLSEKEGK
jgi:hypothetical protein